MLGLPRAREKRVRADYGRVQCNSEVRGVVDVPVRSAVVILNSPHHWVGFEGSMYPRGESSSTRMEIMAVRAKMRCGSGV